MKVTSADFTCKFGDLTIDNNGTCIFISNVDQLSTAGAEPLAGVVVLTGFW